MTANLDTLSAMDDAGRQVKETLRTIKTHRRITDGQVGAVVGMSAPNVNRYFSGATKVTVEMLVGLANALDVPPHVLLMRADEALRWVLENSPNEDSRAMARAGGGLVASVSPAGLLPGEMEPERRIELLTFSLRVRRSAD